MTKIIVRYNSSDEFISLKTSGHANSADKGEDLVCAAISAVLLGGINTLGNNYKLDVDEKSGKIELSSVGKMNEHDSTAIEVIVNQLQSIARDNPKFMHISIEKDR